VYVPEHFAFAELEELHRFMHEFNFATLVSVIDQIPYATHIPIMLDPTAGEFGTLLGHVAKPNRHRHAFDGRSESLAIFLGPHTYISPTWYHSHPAVPTWNYLAVHAYGVPERINSPEELSGLLDRLVSRYEGPEAAQSVITEEYKAKLLPGIVGFRMVIKRIEGKRKLGQNRSTEDQAGVVAALNANPTPENAAYRNFLQAEKLLP
jgi:transcriptional regulator